MRERAARRPTHLSVGDMLSRMLGDEAVVHARGADGGEPDPATADRHGPVPSLRQKRFRRGRECARRALLDLGSAAVEVGRGLDREPLWPDGYVGSITHVEDSSAASASTTEHLRAMGIDAEIHLPLPAGVEALVTADAAELRPVMGLGPPAVNWPTVLFSAKESVYKAWYPVFGRWLDFADVRIDLSPATPTSGTFRVAPTGAGPMSGAEADFIAVVEGRFEVDVADEVVATVAVARPGGARG